VLVQFDVNGGVRALEQSPIQSSSAEEGLNTQRNDGSYQAGFGALLTCRGLPEMGLVEPVESDLATQAGSWDSKSAG